MADIWSSTWSKLGISNTDFIRTTEERHIEVVNDIWGRMEAAGDIYKGQYEGLYCKGHEAFMKEDELTPDGLCPEHKTSPELVSEENYFFRLSNYQQKLLDFYETHDEFVAPAHRFNEVRAFVENGLEDMSFSREKKEWGIPVPNDPSQVIYVWADALVNYITDRRRGGMGRASGGRARDGERYRALSRRDLASDAHVRGIAVARADRLHGISYDGRYEDVQVARQRGRSA